MTLHPFLAAAAEPGNPVEVIAKQFGVTWQLLISQIILFVIVALALKKFAYGPILKMLDERKQRIAEGLANADKIKTELARTEAARLEILNAANTQANKLIEEARAAAGKVKDVETQKAIAEAAQIIAKAREASALEKAAELAKLRREVGRLVVQTTTQVTGKILTTEDQQRLAEETTKQLAA